MHEIFSISLLSMVKYEIWLTLIMEFFVLAKSDRRLFRVVIAASLSVFLACDYFA